MRGQPDYDSVELALHDLEEGRDNTGTGTGKRMKSHDVDLNFNDPEPTQ